MLTKILKFGNEYSHIFYLSLDEFHKKHFRIVNNHFVPEDAFDKHSSDIRYPVKRFIESIMNCNHKFGEFCQRKLYKASDREIQDLDHYTALLIKDLLVRFKQIKGVENIQPNLLIDINEIINCFSVENGLSRYKIKQGFDLFAKNCNDFYF
jgi:hypothetical protein